MSIQRTISKSLTFSGIGLHSGELVTIELRPQEINKGISFVFKNKSINALWKNTEVSQLCTKIKSENIYISTVEHLMSSLSGLGISNLIIKTNSQEMPILDGSAKEFYEKLIQNKIIDQKQNQKKLLIKKKVRYSLENKFIEIKPHNKKNLIIDYSIDYKDQFIKKQKLVYEHNELNYKDIYKARTFCLHGDLEKIFALGLAKGGSLDNAIVVSGKKILNQGGLRYHDEFVKHKILDCIGDIYLAGYPIIGKLTCFGGGHELNLMLLREIFKSKENYEIIN